MTQVNVECDKCNNKWTEMHAGPVNRNWYCDECGSSEVVAIPAGITAYKYAKYSCTDKCTGCLYCDSSDGEDVPDGIVVTAAKAATSLCRDVMAAKRDNKILAAINAISDKVTYNGVLLEQMRAQLKEYKAVSSPFPPECAAICQRKCKCGMVYNFKAFETCPSCTPLHFQAVAKTLTPITTDTL